MSEIFIVIDEAADLEGLKYNSMVQKIQRDPEQYRTVTEKTTDGGRDRVLVALSSLSKKARRAYGKALKLQGDDIVAESRGMEVPWYVEADLAWYIENNQNSYHRAVELSADIKAFLEYDESDRTAFADEFAAEMGISARTLYRYAESYLEGGAWAQHKSREDGENYDYFRILSLCRKPKDRNTFPSLSAEQRALIENIWFNKEFAANQGTVEMLYTQFERHYQEMDQEYPSYQTVARYISYLMNTKRMANAYELASKGEREYKRNVQLKGIRDTSAVPVMGIVQGDSHTFDFWVSYRDPSNGKVSAVRPTMVAWIDTRSRVVMGCVMAKTVNAQVVKQSMIKLVYEYGVPGCIIIDNGKDYTAEEMTGVNRKVRKKSAFLKVDKEGTGFYKSVGIKDDYRTLPYQPWSKGQVERFFLTVCDQFSRWFVSYTGTLTGSRTDGKVKKNITKMLEGGKLVTMEEAYALFDKWLQDIYHQRPHGGLKKIGERYTKPMELFEKAEDHIRIPAPPRALAAKLLMKPGTAKINQTGIGRFGQHYMNYALTAYVNKTLPIRWDPSDVSRLYVYDDKDGHLICEAECSQLLQFQGLISEKQLTEHCKMQKKQLADDRKLLEDARTPYELRAELGGPAIAGALDLMIENRNQKPDVDISEEKETARAKNSYFEEKAREAVKKLRELG